MDRSRFSLWSSAPASGHFSLLFEQLIFFLRSAGSAVADRLITNPVYRWTWRSFGNETFSSAIPEIRPADPPSATDMVQGKYLFGSRVVETGGVSPFSVDADDREWLAELHGFAWLRHFADSRDPTERRFARTLVLDWIGRYGHFNRYSWRNDLAARRVLNWLRHLDLLLDDANGVEKGQITRAISEQVQSLRQRGAVDMHPVGPLLAAIALLGVAICQPHGASFVELRAARMRTLLEEQIDKDGLHMSRNPRHQYDLLSELAPVRLALQKAQPELAQEIGKIIEKMHAALSDLTMTTGEPGYFNGCGQLPLEMLLAVQSRAALRGGGNVTRRLSGYGITKLGQGKVVIDSGTMPPLVHAGEMHAGLGAFEYSCGNELIVCNCGPAPGTFEGDRDAFRRTAAHSTLSVEGAQTARLASGLLARGKMLAVSEVKPVAVDPINSAVEVSNLAFAGHGVRHVRTLSLDGDGQTLIGQDLLARTKKSGKPVNYLIRFHLGPGARAVRREGAAAIRIQTQSGDPWVFLWEAADAEIEPSVRQSAYFGMYDTQQIILHGTLQDREEVAWTFTRQFG